MNKPLSMTEDKTYYVVYPWNYKMHTCSAVFFNELETILDVMQD